MIFFSFVNMPVELNSNRVISSRSIRRDVPEKVFLPYISRKEMFKNIFFLIIDIPVLPKSFYFGFCDESFSHYLGFYRDHLLFFFFNHRCVRLLVFLKHLVVEIKSSILIFKIWAVSKFDFTYKYVVFYYTLHNALCHVPRLHYFLDTESFICITASTSTTAV